MPNIGEREVGMAICNGTFYQFFQGKKAETKAVCSPNGRHGVKRFYAPCREGPILAW